MTPKQIIEWIGDKAILAAALLWVSAEVMFAVVILLPLQIVIDAVVWVYLKLGGRFEEEEKELE